MEKAVAPGAVAAHGDAVSGVLLITPWDRLAQVAAVYYPRLPVKWLLRDEYDSVAYLANFPRPVVVTVTEHDRIVPARLGQRIHAALSGQKQLSAIADSGHNDLPERVDDAWWRKAIAAALGEPGP